MIKKIYDRDTGNIYDVGADNKLKLVAEGTLNYRYDELLLSENYGNIYNFENNKIYLIIIHEDEDLICSLFGTKMYGRLMTTISTETYGDQKIFAKYNDIDKVFELCNLEETSIAFSGFTYKIYELPFSL